MTAAGARASVSRMKLLAAAALAALPPVVPWLDRQPAHAPAHPPRAAACRASDLRAQLFLQGETGMLVGGVDLTNRSERACALVGRPRVSFTGASRRWRAEALPRQREPLDVLADPPGSLRALAPGKTAEAVLEWTNWCGRRPAGLRVTLAGGGSLVVPLRDAPRCERPSERSTLGVAPLAPAVAQLPSTSRLPLRARIVGSRPVAFLARPGETSTYAVALTNTSEQPFRFGAPCPVYVVALTPGRVASYVLNCQPVPEIAPHATVRFEMRLPVPPGQTLGRATLSWELAPQTYLAPYADASVAVVP
jgi:hypothetical protein